METAITFMDILGYLERFGTLGLLVFILWSGLRQIWVWGWMYRQERKEKEEWKKIALDALNVTDKAIDVADGKKRR